MVFKKQLSDEERFWSKVKTGTIPSSRPDLGECWIWQGSDIRGYGQFHIGSRTTKRKTVKAHRFSYELSNGPIPDGLTIDHLCQNTLCVRPDHLEPVTFGVNTLRGDTITSRNASKTCCSRGHLYDVIVIRSNGSVYRRCSQCNRENMRNYRQRHKIA